MKSAMNKPYLVVNEITEYTKIRCFYFLYIFDMYKCALHSDLFFFTFGTSDFQVSFIVETIRYMRFLKADRSKFQNSSFEENKEISLIRKQDLTNPQGHLPLVMRVC